MTVLNDNRAWSELQDERAVIDARSGRLVVSSEADGSGVDGGRGTATSK